MKPSRFSVPACAAALFLAGCGQAPRQVSERDLKEAAALSSEAQFAMSVSEWARAEAALLKAVKITPEAVFYHNLGIARARQKNRAGAKEAYQSAIDACDRWAAAKKTEPEPLLKKIQLLALIGRPADARALQQKVEKEFAADPAVRAFVEGKALDAFMASSSFKENAL